MIIKVERTGGFAGIEQSREMTSDDLPASLRAMLPKLVSTMTHSMPSKHVPKGAADHYSYKITLNDGVQERVLECSEYDIQDNLKSLITYVEKHTKEKKRE